jgi:hypothetical protein
MTRMRLSPSPRKSFAAAWLALAALTAPLGALAQTQALEPDLKAAIITNMLLFVEWPASSSFSADQLTICHQGTGSVATALAKLDGKTVRNKLVRVVPVNSVKPTECQALYLSPENVATLDKILSMMGSLPVLIVSDSPEYFQRGTMLNLELVAGRIVFDINLRSVQKAGLQVSSKALRMARQVTE